MIMIVHQRIGMDHDAIAFAKFGHQFQKVYAIPVFVKYRTPFHPVTENMIPSVCNQST